MNYVYGLIKETFPACWHPYTPGLYTGKAIAKVMPIIQQERPDILQGLQRGHLSPTQIYAEVAKLSKPVS
jgi:hypothetical protein